MRKLVKDVYYNLLSNSVLFYFINIDKVEIIFNLLLFMHKRSDFRV